MESKSEMAAAHIAPANTAKHTHADAASEKETLSIGHLERARSAIADSIAKEHVDFSRIDGEVAKYATAEHVVVSKADDRRLRHAINRRILSVMVFTYFLQALDKGTMSFAAIMNIRTDLHLVGQQYAWLTTCIYIAILIVEYPINLAIQRLPIGKFLGTAIVLWGTVLASHAACTSFASLVAVRTMLGIFESVCQPSFLILSSMWYKRSEQAETVTYWYMMNGGQQIVGGLLAYCFTLIGERNPINSWQAIFITYGCLSVIWGGFVLWWLPDSPMRAKCFSEEDKTLIVERVRGNQTGLQNKIWRKDQFIEALKDPQAYCYAIIQITTTLPTSGLGAFSGIIITGFHFTILQTQLLSMVLGAVIIFILLSSTWLVKRTGQNCLIMGLYVIPSFIGTVVLMTVVNKNTATKAGLLISYYIALSFWAAQTLAMSMISRNIAGQTKKSVVVAMNFVGWAAGNAAGPQVFLVWDAPRYFIAFATHMGCYVVLVFDIIFLWWWLRRQNSEKDRLASQGVIEADASRVVHAWDDLTDQQNQGFRYIY